MPNFLHKKLTFSMENRSLADTTQDLTFKVTHKVIKVKFVIIYKLYLAFRYINICLIMMLQLVLGSISVSNSNIDIGELYAFQVLSALETYITKISEHICI